MKDVYSCWDGFVAMFGCGVAKKKQERKKNSYVVWFGHEFM
jgi:hypothetical protein